MPETIPENIKEFSRSLSRLPGIFDITSQETQELLAKENEVEFVGKGIECVVVTINKQDRHVVAFRYTEVDPKDAKALFYTEKVLSTLFPYNFPHFHSSFSQSSNGELLGGTIRTKINEAKGAIVQYPFAPTKKIIRSDLHMPISLDTADFNYVIGQNRGEYYLDTALPLKGQVWDKEKILNYMRDNPRQDGKKYSEYDIRVVSKSIDRLEQLGFAKILK